MSGDDQGSICSMMEDFVIRWFANWGMLCGLRTAYG